MLQTSCWILLFSSGRVYCQAHAVSSQNLSTLTVNEWNAHDSLRSWGTYTLTCAVNNIQDNVHELPHLWKGVFVATGSSRGPLELSFPLSSSLAPCSERDGFGNSRNIGTIRYSVAQYANTGLSLEHSWSLEDLTVSGSLCRLREVSWHLGAFVDLEIPLDIWEPFWFFSTLVTFWSLHDLWSLRGFWESWWVSVANVPFGRPHHFGEYSCS